MGIFNDVLGLLRLAPVPEGESPPPPVTANDLAAMGERILAERAEAEALIAGAAFRRDELLMQPGSDALIRKLERDVDGAHLMLERLDRIEPELRRQYAARQDDDRAGRWIEQRRRVIEQLALCQITMQAYVDAFSTLIALRNEVDRAGFGRDMQLLPWHMRDVHGPAVYAELIRWYRERGVVPLERPQDVLINVKFLSFAILFEGTPAMTAYQCQQEAGFPPAQARDLIDRGVAVLADTKTLPPAPKKKAKRRHTQREAIALQEAQEGGRRPVRQREVAEELPPEHPTRTWTRLNPPGGAA